MRHYLAALAAAGLFWACGSDDDDDGTTGTTTGGTTSATDASTSDADQDATSSSTGGMTSTGEPGIKADGGMEDFEDETVGAVPSGFAAQAGTADATWSVADDAGNKVLQVKAPSGGVAYTLMSDAGAVTTGTIEIKVRIDAEPGDPRCGLAFFGEDADNFVYAAINSVEGNIHARYFKAGERLKHDPDAETLMTVTLGEWYDLKVDISSQGVKVFVNGTEQLSFSHAVLTGTKVGFFGRHSECSFDDFKVSTVS